MRTLADIQADLTKLQHQIPPGMRSQLDPDRILPPQEKAMFLAVLVNALTQLEGAPLHAKVDAQPIDNGWNVAITLPAPEIRDDIEVGQ